MAAPRTILTLTGLATLLLPYLADWNAAHTFGPEWSPHARLHAVAGIFESTGWALTALTLLWLPGTAAWRLRVLVVALVPIFHWGMFLPALLAPNIAPNAAEETVNVIRLFGLPVNIVLFIMLTLMGVLAIWLSRDATQTERTNRV